MFRARPQFTQGRQMRGRAIALVLREPVTGMHPVEALKWLDENMAAYYKLGELKKPDLS